ncbi:hypothetical protein [Haloarchaeobius sp. HRN-SO-5]|uniref:hypothetical protein n=1 Tax=Haloarchaeobius sp. HRN-SO-5 TaxID=3446118 RepID=UPI003EB8E0F2
MSVADTAERLTGYRLWVYAGALVAILAVRAVVTPSVLRTVVVGTAVFAMVVTFGAERLAAASSPEPSALLLGAAVVGIVAGLFLALTGTLAGLLFLAGGLLLVERGVRGGPP